MTASPERTDGFNIYDLFDNNKIPRVLIVVAEKAHKNNWKNEIKTFSNKAEQILNNITIICIVDNTMYYYLKPISSNIFLNSHSQFHFP